MVHGDLPRQHSFGTILRSELFLVVGTWLDLLNSEKVEVPILTP